MMTFMTESGYVSIIVAFIVAMPTVLATLVSIWMGVRHDRKLTMLKIQINGRMDQLLKLTAKESHQSGVTEEHDRNAEERNK